ncbi:MAG: hypothetical protein V4436_01555 [Patescibacteria group bacterium]
MIHSIQISVLSINPARLLAAFEGLLSMDAKPEVLKKLTIDKVMPHQSFYLDGKWCTWSCMADDGAVLAWTLEPNKPTGTESGVGLTVPLGTEVEIIPIDLSID